MRLPTRDGEDMKTRISALMDGELEGHEIADTLGELRRSEDLRSEWCDCQLIGAALRDESKLELDVTARVMAALELEPTVIAPARRRADAPGNGLAGPGGVRRRRCRRGLAGIGARRRTGAGSPARSWPACGGRRYLFRRSRRSACKSTRLRIRPTPRALP